MGNVIALFVLMAAVSLCWLTLTLLWILHLKQHTKSPAKNSHGKNDRENDGRGQEASSDRELREALLIADGLLGELPDDALDRFIRSPQYKHYKRVLERIRHGPA